MARYLIDTNVFIWWFRDDARLRPKVTSLLSEPANSIAISIITPWEVTLKTATGKLEGGDAILSAIDKMVSGGALDLLTPAIADLAVLRQLPLHHRDPFDRMLIAQAIRQSLPVVSSDTAFKDYDVPVVW